MGTDYKVVCPDCKVGMDAGFSRRVFGKSLRSDEFKHVMNFISKHVINCGEVKFIPDDCNDPMYQWTDEPRITHAYDL